MIICHSLRFALNDKVPDAGQHYSIIDTPRWTSKVGPRHEIGGADCCLLRRSVLSTADALPAVVACAGTDHRRSGRARATGVWNDAVLDAYVRVTCDAPGGDVVGDIRVDSLATLELSQVTATAQYVHRTPSLIATASEDYFLVTSRPTGSVRSSRTGAPPCCGRATSRSTTRPARTSCASTPRSSSTCSCSPVRRCAPSCGARRSSRRDGSAARGAPGT